MDKDITMERLITDLEEVISQINDIVKRKDVAAAKKAMEQIANIVKDDSDVELDTSVDPNMDNVLHELLSRIDGAIITKADRIRLLDESEESYALQEQLDIRRIEIDAIDYEINRIRREGKSNKPIVLDGEESETTEDKTLSEISIRIENLEQRRDELNNQFSNYELTDATELFRELGLINAEIRELKARKDTLTKELDEQRNNQNEINDKKSRIAQLTVEIANLQEEAYKDAYKDVAREIEDSFFIIHNDLDIENFQAGTTIKIDGKEITLDPTKHRFTRVFGEEVDGDKDDKGPIGYVVLQEIDPEKEIDPEIKKQIEEKIKEREALVKSLVPDRRAQVAEIDGKLKTLRETADSIKNELKDLKDTDERYKELLAQLTKVEADVESLEIQRRDVLTLQTRNSKRGPTRIIGSDYKLSAEQKNAIQILLNRKNILNSQITTLAKDARKHTNLISLGEDQEYSLTKVARELGDPFFKTHEIRKELAERGVTDEDFLKFYKEGKDKFQARLKEMQADYDFISEEVRKLYTGPHGENLAIMLDDNGITEDNKIKVLEQLRKNFLADNEVNGHFKGTYFENEVVKKDNLEKFVKAFEDINNTISQNLYAMDKELKDIKHSINVLDFEIDTIEKGKEAKKLLDDDSALIKIQASNDKLLRKTQIETTIFGNEEMEKQWDKIIKRFYDHRKESEETLVYKTKDGVEIRVRYDTIADYPNRNFDAHFLNLDEYRKFLELTTAYDNAEMAKPGSGLDCIKQNFDLVSDNPAFEDAYKKILAEQGKEAADRLLLEYINEKKEYVKTFHGLTNSDVVKYATLKTSGSTLKAMKPVRGNLPTPVKYKNAVENVFRFIGIRVPHITKINEKGEKVLNVPGWLGTVAVDLLVGGAIAGSVLSGPAGIATLGAAYVIRGGITALNVASANKFYENHKDVIDAGLPTIGKPPEYIKEVARRDYYRQKVMEESGKNKSGLGRRFTTWFHAKTDRLPFRKASREAGEKALVEQTTNRIEKEITEKTNERIRVAEANLARAKANSFDRKGNFKFEANSARTYNSIFKNPNNNIDEMASNVAINAALKVGNNNLRVDVAKGEFVTAEQAEKGRFKKSDNIYGITREMEVVPDERATVSAATAITEEQHYQGEKEHIDFWNRVITTAGVISFGIGLRAGYNKAIERKMVNEGTKATRTKVHHSGGRDKQWVDPKTETIEVEKTVPDYGTRFDVKGKQLNDVISANKGKSITGYQSVSGGQRGAAEYVINGDEKITAVWQNDGSKWGTGVGDTAGLNQSTGFIDRTIASEMMDGNGFINQNIKVDDLIKAVGSGKVDPKTLDGTFVSLGDERWVPLKSLMEGMTKQVKIGSHIEKVPVEKIIEPGHWETKVFEGWDEWVDIPGTPPTYEDVFSWKEVFKGLGVTALQGAAFGSIDPLHEAAYKTYRTSVDSIGRNGGTFDERNGILTKKPNLIARIVEQQKAAEKADKDKSENSSQSEHADR